ncbi:MAG: tetratricopeptide repeat protein [Candidatus Obscuribacterales bacterium]|nr:tetratricopeptide repeat protein [Candidatus Obscuribacterales bacterium]
MKSPEFEGFTENPVRAGSAPESVAQILADPIACREAFRANENAEAKTKKSEGQLQKEGAEAAASGDFKKAEKIFLELLKLAESNHGRNSKEVASVLTQLGFVCEGDHRFADAEKYYKQAVKVDQVVYGKNAFDTGLNVQNVAHMENLQGNYPEAAKWYEEALRIYRLNDPYNDSVVGKEMVLTLNDYAEMLWKMGNKEEARKKLEEAARIISAHKQTS